MKHAVCTFVLLTAAVCATMVQAAADPDAQAQIERDLMIEAELINLQSSFEAYAAYHGFHLDTIIVPTPDGVLLTVHRIRQKDIYSAEDSTPVVLSHGFAASSYDYMANARNESIAWILADNGYDVWAINYRGSVLSSRTVHTCSPGPEYYYRATWQFMAQYDIPAVLDHILSVRPGKKIHIVGQSMGTSAMFAFLADNHKYDDKIHMFHALTPVSLLGNDTSEGLRDMFSKALELPSHLPSSFSYRMAYGRPVLDGKGPLSSTLFSNKLCLISTSYCNGITGMLFDREKNSNNSHIRQERYPLYYDKYPGGAAMANIYLFSAQFNRDNWTKMDFNKIKLPGMSNQVEYGQDTAPEYDFTTLKVKLALYYTENDVFTGVDTAKKFGARMTKQLVQGGMHMIEGNRLSHQDSLWAWDARCYMYDSVVKDMETFEKGKTAYRKKVQEHLTTLKFEDGCKSLPTKSK